MKLEELLRPNRVLVAVEDPELLTEATRGTVSLFTARRDLHISRETNTSRTPQYAVAMK